MATELDKTLVIHDRDAHADVIAVLEGQRCAGPGRVPLLQWRRRAWPLTAPDEGWFMSFAGPVTYKANDALRAALAVVPDELLLVETDAPYLTPVPHRGKPNASYLMPHTVRFIAKQREVDEAVLCGTCCTTTRSGHSVPGERRIG